MFRIMGNDNNFFSVQGCWNCYLDGDRRADTLEYASTWNNEHFMPQTEVVSYDDGDQQFVTDHVVDYSYGLTDEKLCRHIGMGCIRRRDPSERSMRCSRTTCGCEQSGMAPRVAGERTVP